MPRILIVEDEDKLRRALQRGLSDEGYDVTAVEDGDLGLAFAVEETFDCLILDLMLPGRDGMDILTTLRAGGFPGPILILSARGSLEDRVRGLDLGADDYLAKPFAWSELLARLRACLRRRTVGEASLLRAGRIDLDRVHRRLSCGAREVELTIRECELLEYLIRRVGQVVDRDQLAREVWGDPGVVQTNVIDVFVNYLRKKLDRVEASGMIDTIRGVGYLLKG
ncbi:response regulator transcription factor [Planctomyces sp. SH-PL62]|uniref:response regulator transcription factor n=1 Tax=Planctomyces sp. SH-PL62 TaxID=1636152 RepID=UPI00078D8428|nr:response regulator transcription factor [Planctomyces sp. SH-PL62]AMV38722.1 Transcriptional activator protein CzcR [Planctomyces sp. SH-PL62]